VAVKSASSRGRSDGRVSSLFSRCGGMQTKRGSYDALAEAGAMANEEGAGDAVDYPNAPAWDNNIPSPAHRRRASRVAKRGVGSFAVPGLPEAVWCGFSGDAQDGQGSGELRFCKPHQE